MKLTHDEKMILRSAANILRKHIGRDGCFTCDNAHSICEYSEYALDGCPIEGFMLFVDDYIHDMDTCDAISRCFRSCKECADRRL